MYNFGTGVGLRNPVIKGVASFSGMSTIFAYADLLQTGHAYSPAEKHNAKVAVHRV